MVKNRSTLWYAALIVGWAFDILYWKKPPGISFAIHVSLLLGVLAFLAYKEGVKPRASSLILVPADPGFQPAGIPARRTLHQDLKPSAQPGFPGAADPVLPGRTLVRLHHE